MKQKSGFSVSSDGGGQLIEVANKGFFARLFAAGFMAVWLSFWTLGCVFLAGMLINDFSVFLLVFSLPFFASWFAGAAFLLFMLFGREQMYIDALGIEFRTLCLICLSKTRVPFKEVRSISIKEAKDSEDSSAVIVETVGKPIKVGSDLSQRELRELANFLRDQVPGLGKQPLIEEGEQSDESNAHLQIRKKRPSLCRWDVEPSFGGETTFINRGRFELGPLLGSLFINIFWNGIVTVFLLAPFQDDVAGGKEMGWFLYLFLTPFILIGLCMLFHLVTLLLEPLRTSRFTISDRSITRVTRYLLFSRTKLAIVIGPVDMGVQQKQKSKSAASEGSNFSISFEESSKQLMLWKNLTRGEAEWLTTTIEKLQPNYRVAQSTILSQ